MPDNRRVTSLRPGATRPADGRSPPGAELEKTRPRRRLLIRWGLFLVVPVVFLAAAILYVTGGRVMSTDNAYVDAEKVGISTDVSGIVTAVDVVENQRVAAGQVLYRLDDRPYVFALQRAEAQIGIVRNELEALKASYGNVQAQIAQARDDIAYYQREFHRQQTLARAHVVSEANLDTAQRNLRNAQTRLAALDKERMGIQANLNGDPEASITGHPRYLDAVASRDEAARQLDHAIVKAPFAGIITDVTATTPGKYLQASQTAFYLVATDHVWVEANPKETELTYVRPGQKATVTVDSYPDVEWHGVVDSISPAAAQEFALLPAQNTSGNWVKVVQRIPMRIRIDTSDPALPPLRAGMSVEAEVDTGHARGLPHFLKALMP